MCIAQRPCQAFTLSTLLRVAQTIYMVKPVLEWPNDQYVDAEDDDNETSRFYWMCKGKCPAGPDSPCMKSENRKNETSWGRALKGMWSYVGEEEVVDKIVDHLTTSSHHYMGDDDARQMVNEYLEENSDAIEVWEETPADRAKFRSLRGSYQKAKDNTHPTIKHDNTAKRLVELVDGFDVQFCGTQMLKELIESVKGSPHAGPLLAHLDKTMLGVAKQHSTTRDNDGQHLTMQKALNGMVNQLQLIRSMFIDHEASVNDRIANGNVELASCKARRKELEVCIRNIQDSLRVGRGVASSSSSSSTVTGIGRGVASGSSNSSTVVVPAAKRTKVIGERR